MEIWTIISGRRFVACVSFTGGTVGQSDYYENSHISLYSFWFQMIGYYLPANRIIILKLADYHFMAPLQICDCFKTN